DDYGSDDSDEHQGEYPCRPSLASRWARRAICIAGCGAPHIINFDACIADVAKSELLLLLKATAQQTADAFGSLGRQPAPGWLFFKDSTKNLASRLALKHRPSCEHFVEHTPKCPHVRRPADFFTFPLFRRHGACRSH